MPALRLAVPAEDNAHDDATEVTRTDVVGGMVPSFVDPELVEEGPVADALRAPFGGDDPERTAPVVSVVIIDDEDDHWDEPEPAESPAGLELRVLRSELLRLRQDLDELRAEREAALQEVMAASAEAREAHQELADWRAVAERAESRVALLESEVAHYRAFADSGLWSRLRGCAPYTPPA
jgi:hypothetical protein